MVKIRRHLAPLTRTSGRGNKRKYITIHETANRSRGANANAHARLQAGVNSRQASWHYTVDSTEIVQSFDDNVRCWHAGARANNESIAIEICVNSDGNYDKAVDNAAALVAHLRKKHGIPATRVVSHNFWTGKNCPTIMLSRPGQWDRFIKATDPQGAAKVSASTTKPKTKRSWFDMATESQLRKIIKEEIRVASWAYRGKANKDAWAILREILSVVKNIRDNSRVRPWLYKGAKDPRDMHAVLKQTDRNVAAIKGTVDGLVEAVKQIDGVDPAEIGRAVNDGVSKALSSLEADVSLNINTSEETPAEPVDNE